MTKRDWSDYLNPVLVKEIRQYFHNYFILAITGLMLLAQLGALVYAQTEIQNGRNLDAKTMILTQMVILLLFTFAACGITGEIRFAVERSFPELDYSRISPLTPMQILLGKSFGAVILSLYMISLTIPFMLIAYFMHGVSILEILALILALLIVSFFTATCGLFFGASGKKWTIWLYIPTPALLIYLLNEGYCSDFEYLASHRPPLWGFSLLLFTMALLFTFTLALLGNPRSNRIFSIRIYLMLLPLLFIPAAAISYELNSHGTVTWLRFLTTVAIAGGSGAVVIMSVLATCERDSAGPELLNNCPVNPWLAKLKFLFSSGWSGGIVLSWMLIIFMALAMQLSLIPPNDPLCLKTARSTVYPDMYTRETLKYIALALYFLFYAEASILLRNILKIEGWICFSIIAVFFAILPLILFGSKSQHQYYEDFYYLLTTPFNLQGISDSSAKKILTVYYTAWGLAVAGLIPICGDLWRNFRAFRRIEKEQLNEA